MRTLYLHIGQGKTGTSYLQTALTLSRLALSENGIAYPVNPKAIERADNGLNSGGNGISFCNIFDAPSKAEDYIFPQKGNVLLSYEGLISRLLFEGSDELLGNICRANGFETVSMLVFCRNPVSHAVSSYRQLVKRSGMAKPLDKYCETYNAPRQLSRFLDRYHDRTHINFTSKISILNYSICKKNLLTELAAWLSVKTDVITPSKSTTVNRSLTLGELVFQRELNRYLGSKGQLLSDPLFENLLDIKPEKLLPSIDAQQGMMKRLRPYMDMVNKNMKYPSHHYEEDIEQPDKKLQTEETIKYEFTNEQLNALAKVYARAFKS